jgi:hypothetical protein
MNLDQLIQLAKEVEMADPIDWEGLSISENAAYTLIASSILERYESGEIDNTVLLGTLTKLAVENFILNMRLLKYREIDL